MKSLFQSNSPTYPVLNDVDTYIIFDVANMCHKAYHIFHLKKRLATSKGIPSGHVYGILSMVMTAFEKYRDGRTALVFALEGEEQEKRGVGGYKENRPEKRDKFKGNLNPIPDQLMALRYLPGLQIDMFGGEGDDAIYQFVSTCKQRCFIVSSDKDLWSLASNRVSIINGLDCINHTDVTRKLGVPPEKVHLFKSVFGDPSDNLPRVPRVRSKNLMNIVRESETLSDIIKRLRFYTQDPKHFLNVITNYYLVTPTHNVVRKTWYVPTPKKVKEFVERWELNSLKNTMISWAKLAQKDM